jgi:hypothetical protein
VVFLSPEAFKREKDAAAWLPLATKGRCYEFKDWLYRKECVAKGHPVLEGLQGRGILERSRTANHTEFSHRLSRPPYWLRWDR